MSSVQLNFAWKPSKSHRFRTHLMFCQDQLSSWDREISVEKVNHNKTCNFLAKPSLVFSIRLDYNHTQEAWNLLFYPESTTNQVNIACEGLGLNTVNSWWSSRKLPGPNFLWEIIGSQSNLNLILTHLSYWTRYFLLNCERVPMILNTILINL